MFREQMGTEMMFVELLGGRGMGTNVTAHDRRSVLDEDVLPGRDGRPEGPRLAYYTSIV